MHQGNPKFAALAQGCDTAGSRIIIWLAIQEHSVAGKGQRAGTGTVTASHGHAYAEVIASHLCKAMSEEEKRE